MIIDTNNIKSNIKTTDNQEILEIANKCYSQYGFYPISFSNYENAIKVTGKKQILATVNPKDTSTYIFNNETDYCNNYKESQFGITMIKAGWDCNRHLEIMRNSCLPLFENIHLCPEFTMIHYPKELFLEILIKQERLLKEPALYDEYITRIINHYNKHLTNEAMIRYIFDVLKVEINENMKILFIDSKCPGFADYQSVFALNGLKKIFKNNCDVLYPNEYVYSDTKIDTLKLYGKGFAYSKVLDPEWKTEHEKNNNQTDTIIKNIHDKYYDYIFYGSVFRSLDHFNLVMEKYPKNKIITLCGEDIGITQTLFCNRLKHYSTLFVREIFNLTPKVYHLLSNNSSYINEHLVNISKYSELCNTSLVITNNNLDGLWGIANGFLNNNNKIHKKIILTGEIEDNKMIDFKFEMVNNNIQTAFKDNKTDIINENFDLLFIDHIHISEFLLNQLNTYSRNINKFIIIHGISKYEVFAETFENDNYIVKYNLNKENSARGIGFSILEFLYNNKNWTIKEKLSNNNGLIILERK